MHEAFKAWDAAQETLESIEDRIHDGVPREKLLDRGAGYAARVLAAPTWMKLRPKDLVVEIGSGVGYVMQALADQAGLERVTGLDVAPAMIEHAKARLQRDGLPAERFAFQHYDGITLPWKDGTVDLFYSVAVVLHIPKPLAYHLMLEIQRCLKPGGTAVLQTLSWDFLPHHHLSFAQEIENQVKGTTTHWHHFYDRIELETILTHGLHVREQRIAQEGASIWVAWRK